MTSIKQTTVEKIKAHILYSITFFKRAFYEAMLKNMGGTNRPQMTI